MTYDKIINFLKDKSLLIAILIITFIVLMDNKSYVYIGPDTFKIEKKPSSSNNLVDGIKSDNRLSDIVYSDNNASHQIEKETR